MFQDHKVAYLRKHVKIRHVQRFSMLRQTVSHMLSLAAKNIPHAAMNTDLDVTPLLEYCGRREREIRSSAKESGDDVLTQRAIHKSYSAFFVKAIAHALHHTPCLNAFLDYTPWRNGGTLYHAEDVNIGVTVNTKYGVVRPIVRNAHQKPLSQVADELRDLSRRARKTDPEELYRQAAKRLAWIGLKELDFKAILPLFISLRTLLFNPYKPDPEYMSIPQEKKLTVDEILGATCTLANIGMVVAGHQTVTVITPPEVAMFGLGDIHLAPKVVKGEIVARHVITLCAVMDHRAYDAGEAFPFSRRFLKYLRKPELIYEWESGHEI